MRQSGGSNVAPLIGLLLACAGVLLAQTLGLIPNLNDILFAKDGVPQTSSAQTAATPASPQNFDEDTTRKIVELIGDFQFDPQKHTLEYAIQLDRDVGRPHVSQGNHREAYRTYQEVLGISYYRDSQMGVQIGLGMLSSELSVMNRRDESIQVRILAYRVSKAMNNPEESGVNEMSIARLLRETDRAAALGWLAKARESLRGTRYRSDYVRVLLAYAEDVATLTGKDAAHLYEEVWLEVQELGNNPGQRWAKWEVGLSYASFLTKQKRYDRAKKVMAITTSWIDPVDEANETHTTLLFRLAKLFADSEQDKEAENYYRSAYANYEVHRVMAPGEDPRAKLDVSYKDSIDEFIEFYIAQGKIEQALVLLEANKGRTLSDITTEPHYRDRYIALQNMETEFAEARRELFNTKDLESQLDSGPIIEKFERLNEQQAKKIRALRTNTQLSSFAAAEPFTTEHLTLLRAQIPSDTLLVAMFVSKRVSGAFVTNRDRIDWVKLPESPRVYENRAQQLKVALSNSETDYYREPARFFYDRLVQPILESVPDTVTSLVVSPDGFLETVPLGVALSGDRFLVEIMAVSRVPSFRFLTSFGVLRSAAARAGVSCTDPAVKGARLPFQHDTSKVLTNVFGDSHTELSGVHCNIAELRTAIRDLKGKGFLHVGAHGQFYSGAPMESAIYLASQNPDAHHEEWNVRSIATTDLRQVSLVTLSSCETGVVAKARPRDVFGILRGFYFAGAEQIIAPLWSVQDRSTAKFMQTFYRSYNAGNESVASVLRRTKQDFRHSEKYHHPFYWAGFVLFAQAS